MWRKSPSSSATSSSRILSQTTYAEKCVQNFPLRLDLACLISRPRMPPRLPARCHSNVEYVVLLAVAIASLFVENVNATQLSWQHLRIFLRNEFCASLNEPQRTLWHSS